MKILITGFAGFVSKNFLNWLAAKKEESLVIGVDRNDVQFDKSKYKNICFEIIKADLKDKEVVKKILAKHSPEYILHLASASSVQYSWQHPSEVFINNNTIFIAVLDAVKEYGKSIRILSTGTADVYGKSAVTHSPVKETAELNPANPYAASKASVELMSKVYIDSFGLDIIQTRSFIHFGPYQKSRFVLAKFAKQLTLIKKKKQEPVITVGNIDLIRDLTDVRDIVNAYNLLLKDGKQGEIYNVCSGKGTQLRTALETMIKQLDVDVELKLDATLLRQGETPSIIGSNEKIKTDTGWQPEILFEKSIADLLEYWNEKV